MGKRAARDLPARSARRHLSEANTRGAETSFFHRRRSLDAYLREYRNQGKKDAGRLEIAWNHLKGMFETECVEEICTDSISQFIEKRRTEGASNGTINRETATLSAMFNHGTRVTPPTVDRVPAFPKRLKESAPRKGFIADTEYAKLAANSKNTLWLRALVACAYSFGFRKGELLNLRVRQVDLLDRWIDLEGDGTKNGEARKIPMTAEVFELLRLCLRGKKPEGYVFTREDGSRVADPRDDWYSLCVASELGIYVPAKRKNGEDYNRYVGLNLHDFRRSAIRNMTRRGVNDKTAMRISGHKTFSVFQRYNIVDEADLVEASKRIERGRQVPVSETESDTETDTSKFAVS